MKDGNKNIEKAGNAGKGIRWALWLYGFMALWLYGFMALWRRFKNIFIVLKQRLVQIFQRKRNYFVQINFAEKNYLYTTASGNLLRRCYKAIAGGVVVPLRFVAFSISIVTTSGFPVCFSSEK